MTDTVSDLLAELGRPAQAGEDSLASLDAALRTDPGLAPRVIDRLTPKLAAFTGAGLGRAQVALANAHLARRDAAKARDVLIEALVSLEQDAPARGRASLRLATVELLLQHKNPARAAVARALPEILALEEAAQEELGRVLQGTGDSLAATVLEHHMRGRRESAGGSGAGGTDRLQVLARLLRALNSAASGTSEPLYAILRAVLDESGAERGFLMVYDAETLRFELGLARTGRVLGPGDFAFSTTIVEKALEGGHCIVLPDVAAAVPVSLASSVQGLGIQGALCAPLRVERRRPGAATAAPVLPQVKNVAGVLYVDSTIPGKFREQDAPFFEVLADGAVLALRARASLARPATSETVPATARPASAPRPDVDPDPELTRRYPEIVSRDGPLRSVLSLIDRVAPSDANVLIRGESGTGKELLARALHRRGNRAAGPFEVLDCGAIPEELAQSELFGHEKNAFTGAAAPRAGIFERADKGTLFLDHVSELSASLQASLLRVLQEGDVRRLGSDKVKHVDVRVVAATARDLKAMVDRGDFRHDLLFRLAVVELKIPPLRERRGDVALLAKHFLEKNGRDENRPPLAIEPEALSRLEEHGWPGNVRELENVIAAASLHAEGSITRAQIDHLLGVSRPALRLEGTVEEIEKRALEERLEMFQWNQVQAAKSLGLDRNTLRRKIVRYGIVRKGGGGETG